jgi:hypothetical protein
MRMAILFLIKAIHFFNGISILQTICTLKILRVMKNQSVGSFTFTTTSENEVTKLYTLVFLGILTDNIRIVFHICVQTIHPVPAKPEPGILVWGDKKMGGGTTS